MALNSMTEEKKIIQNGFKAAGLYPFDAHNVDFNVLKKRKSKNNLETAVHDQHSKVDELVAEKLILAQIEKDLKQSLLEEFYNSYQQGIWSGNVENKALFEFWQRKKQSLG